MKKVPHPINRRHDQEPCCHARALSFAKYSGCLPHSLFRYCKRTHADTRFGTSIFLVAAPSWCAILFRLLPTVTTSFSNNGDDDNEDDDNNDND